MGYKASTWFWGFIPLIATVAMIAINVWQMNRSGITTWRVLLLIPQIWLFIITVRWARTIRKIGNKAIHDI